MAWLLYFRRPGPPAPRLPAAPAPRIMAARDESAAPASRSRLIPVAPPPPIGHNGGPLIESDGVRDVAFYLPEKFLCLFEPRRHKAFYGGRGSAKSHSVATYLVIIAAQSTKRIVCCRQFQNSLRDSSKELIEQKIYSLGMREEFTITEREIIHKYNGSRFTFVGLDRNPDAIKSLEGADIAWVEEASTISERSRDILIPTVRKPMSEIIWTWNPDKESDAVDAYFRGKYTPPNSFVVRVGWEDNPWFFHTEMPREMWFMQLGNHDRYRHIWLGEYDNTYDGRVFTNIVIDRYNVPEYCSPRYGADFGFGNSDGADPSSVVKLFVDEPNRVIYVERENTGHVSLLDMPDFVRSVVERDEDWVVGDSSQPQTIDYLNSKGFNFTASVKGSGSVRTGINWLRGFTIWISPECPNLIQEARLYTWQVDRITKKILSSPVDAHNHSWDAVRYATESLHSASESGVAVRRLRNGTQ